MLLHHATAGQELDWWVTFSSAVSLLGNPGQGAYAAANAWFDEFTSWRRAQNLSATCVNWGPWAEPPARPWTWPAGWIPNPATGRTAFFAELAAPTAGADPAGGRSALISG
ncbi:KR domain-containing protein [Streptomyces daghestanicus]|uniref:Ketoreductase (KR) domain-containing protein n=1 Tax=Streptomyces daghestanicus TaxID=66885 RepID=A0ABQ3Q7P9_9ACTN|nr:KR domain-containing protein [Streptomyces daghestanicus]GGU62383.1 hypothetical protein GCM10010259_61260 [Streptomyces daghestanicus]GHI33281.1 hypothetical protein Sdagh_50110 [Streptomyces daghestanicus]